MVEQELQLQDLDVEEYLPTLSDLEAFGIISLTALAVLYGAVVQKKIFQLLAKRSDRAINKVIYFQQVKLT